MSIHKVLAAVGLSAMAAAIFLSNRDASTGEVTWQVPRSMERARLADLPADDGIRAIAAQLAAAEVAKPAQPVRISSKVEDSVERLSPLIAPVRRYPPFSAELRVRTESGENSATALRRVTRSTDRIHVVHLGGAEEWLFVQNPRDAAHFHATRTLHGERELVDYPMTELQLGKLASSWDAIACLGLEPSDFAGLVQSEETKRAFGLEFRRLVPSDSAASGRVRELWWNEEHAIPLELVLATPQGLVAQEITALELTADPEILGEPALRFADYTAFDVSDWREELHDH